MRYGVIYADPPWHYSDKRRGRGGAEAHYSTMGLEGIKALPVAGLADAGCALFMWATWPHLASALSVISAWGFEYRTCAFVWVKATAAAGAGQARLFADDSLPVAWGCGQWTRSNTEFCLLAIRGSVPAPLNRGVHQVIYERAGRHSEKPGEAAARIEALFPSARRVELFARAKRVGWDAWGNEVENSVEMAVK